MRFSLFMLAACGLATSGVGAQQTVPMLPTCRYYGSCNSGTPALP